MLVPTDSLGQRWAASQQIWPVRIGLLHAARVRLLFLASATPKEAMWQFLTNGSHDGSYWEYSRNSWHWSKFTEPPSRAAATSTRYTDTCAKHLAWTRPMELYKVAPVVPTLLRSKSNPKEQKYEDYIIPSCCSCGAFRSGCTCRLGYQAS